MLEQIKTMKYKKQYAYIAGGGVILAILYILISVYITSLAYKTIINMPEISPKDYGLEYEKVEFFYKKISSHSTYFIDAQRNIAFNYGKLFTFKKAEKKNKRFNSDIKKSSRSYKNIS